MGSGLAVSNGSLSHSLPALVEESEDHTDTGSISSKNTHYDKTANFARCMFFADWYQMLSQSIYMISILRHL